MPSDNNLSVSAAEASSLLGGLEHFPALVLAVSGGPDSVALMVLVSRWAQSLKRGPKIVVATIDHGLRAEAKREAADVAKLARALGITHRTLKWTGKKPSTGLQQAARLARYRLLGDAARKAGAAYVLTAHTLDDQAETVLIRMSRGSGITGLAAMARVAPLPSGGGGVELLRPLLDIPKTRLIATLREAKISFATDPSNRDPRFTRARLRGLMPQLAEEGLDARRLSHLAQRLKRADAAIEAMVGEASEWLAKDAPRGALAFETGGCIILPAEIVIRILGRAIAQVGEGPVELGKLEALFDALKAAHKSGTRHYRRSLAGALVTLAEREITVERAPPRRSPPRPKSPLKSLTKGRVRRVKRAK